MTSRERVFTALRCEQPDRVPVLEFVIDSSVAKAAVPGCLDVADCMDQLNMDGVGCGAYFEKKDLSQAGIFVDEWGVEYKTNKEAIPHPFRGPVHTLAEAKAYTPPDPNKSCRLTQLKDIVKRYKGKRAICFHHRAAFMWSAYIMDIENLLIFMHTMPDAVEIIMDKVLECNMQIVRNAIRAGAEIIILGDDYAHNTGPIMSPKHFKYFILPRLKKMIDMIHEEGAYCIKHSDGNVYELLDDLVESGADGLNPFEPVAGMELKKVKQLIGDKVCVTGNIDCAQLLPFGNEMQVRDAVRQAIVDAGKGGGYILTSSNSIHSSCKAENLITMIKACHEYGIYS